MDFYDVVGRQRACRRYSSEDVDDAVVERVLRAATFAPSAENRQPWVFVVVRDPKTRRAIGEVGERVWQAGGRRYAEGRLSEAFLREVDEGVHGGVAGAPVMVVVCGDSEKTPRISLASSIFPAVQNLLLAATAEGLGSAMTTLPLVAGSEVHDLIGLPDHIEPLASVPLGWPARALGPPRREPLVDKAYRDRYGNPWALHQTHPLVDTPPV